MGGSILKLKVPNLLIFSSRGVYKVVHHNDKATKKPWQFKYYPKMVLFGHSRALNDLSSTTDLNLGCVPSLYEMAITGLFDNVSITLVGASDNLKEKSFLG